MTLTPVQKKELIDQHIKTIAEVMDFLATLFPESHYLTLLARNPENQAENFMVSIDPDTSGKEIANAILHQCATTPRYGDRQNGLQESH